MLIEQSLVASTVQWPDTNHPRERRFDVVPALTDPAIQQRQQSINKQESSVYKVQVELLLEGKLIDGVGVVQGLRREWWWQTLVQYGAKWHQDWEKSRPGSV